MIHMVTLRWFGHVEHKDDVDVFKYCIAIMRWQWMELYKEDI